MPEGSSLDRLWFPATRIAEMLWQDGTMPADPLRALVDATREGDDRALAELVRQTQPVVWQVCTALGSAGEVEDLVQETYLRAVRSLDSFRGDAPVRAWLLSIARRVCADHVRRRQRGRRLAERLALDVPDPSVQASEHLDDLLAGIDPDRREAFVLTQLVGLSYEEAAVALGCPIGTVRSRVARARADLVAAVRRAESH
jgi:RNA polymerase sigma-70 factor (ECF subfamily)